MKWHVFNHVDFVEWGGHGGRFGRKASTIGSGGMHVVASGVGKLASKPLVVEWLVQVPTSPTIFIFVEKSFATCGLAFALSRVEGTLAFAFSKGLTYRVLHSLHMIPNPALTRGVGGPVGAHRTTKSRSFWGVSPGGGPG